jgi:aspartate aminotransferase
MTVANPTAVLAGRLRSITPSLTSAATERIRGLRAQGHDVLALAEGEPDFDTPDNIKRAAIAAIERGATKYTAVDGTPELKAAVQEKFRRENRLEFAPEEIIVSAGAKHVIFNALLATVDPGDEVIVPAPYWVSYPEMVALCGGVCVFVPCPEEQGFRLDPEGLERAITPRTKWLILNSPGNPSGAAMSADDLRAVAAVLLRNPHVQILVDDIYEHLTYDNFAFRTLVDVEPGLRERTLTVNGVSKAYCMTGWRIGYGAGPRDLLEAMTAVQSHSTSNPSSIGQAAAIEALTGDQRPVAACTAAFDARRELVLEALNAIPGIRCPRPQGAFYVYPSVAGLVGRTTPSGQLLRSDVDVTDHLMDVAHVGVIAGAAFGLSPHFRLSYAASEAILVESCRRIAEVCEALS